MVVFSQTCIKTRTQFLALFLLVKTREQRMFFYPSRLQFFPFFIFQNLRLFRLEISIFQSLGHIILSVKSFPQSRDTSTLGDCNGIVFGFRFELV